MYLNMYLHKTHECKQCLEGGTTMSSSQKSQILCAGRQKWQSAWIKFTWQWRASTSSLNNLRKRFWHHIKAIAHQFLSLHVKTFIIVIRCMSFRKQSTWISRPFTETSGVTANTQVSIRNATHYYNTYCQVILISNSLLQRPSIHLICASKPPFLRYCVFNVPKVWHPADLDIKWLKTQ